MHRHDPELSWVLGPRGLVRVGDIVTRGRGTVRYRVTGWWLSAAWDVQAGLVPVAGRHYHVTVPLDELHVREPGPENPNRTEGNH